MLLLLLPLLLAFLLPINADAYNACSDVDAMSAAFDDVAYNVANDVDVDAKMLNVARHLAGAYGSFCRCISN